MESLEINTVKRFIEGDEKAFDQIFTLLSRNIWLYFYQNTRSQEITEELVQDAFMRLWKYRSNIDQEQGIKKYLNKIARSIFYNWLQELAKERKMQSEYMDHCKQGDRAVKHEDIYTRMDLNSLIKTSQSLLPEKRRKVFLMSKVSGLSYSEISNELAIGKETVKDHISKATKKLAVLNQSGEYL